MGVQDKESIYLKKMIYILTSKSILKCGKNKKLPTGDIPRSYNHDIAVYGDAVHVVWQDSRPEGRGKYYKMSTTKGEEWSEDELLSNQSNLVYPELPGPDGRELDIVTLTYILYRSAICKGITDSH